MPLQMIDHTVPTVTVDDQLSDTEPHQVPNGTDFNIGANLRSFRFDEPKEQ